MISDVKIVAKEGTARLIVNGEDISEKCIGYSIEQTAGGQCKLSVSMLCRMDFEGKCEIEQAMR